MGNYSRSATAKASPIERDGETLASLGAGPYARDGKFFNQDKGNGGADVFVHVSAIGDGGTLREGQKVTYDLGQDRKTGKSKAENVTAA